MLLTAIGSYSMLTILVNSVFALIIVFVERRNPAVTWAWLMVLALLPVFGFLAYLVLGQDSRKHFVFAQKNREDDNLSERYREMLRLSGAAWAPEAVRELETIQEPNTAWEAAQELNETYIKGLLHLNRNAGGGILTHDNQVTLFYEGHSKFDALLEDIANARSYIFIQYYILRDDDVGRHIVRQLTKRALDGVEVRLLVDGMGCMFTRKSLYKPLREAGGHVALFTPPALVRINFRNHRKLAVIDGLIGYTGGFNIGNEYLGISKRFGYWRDTHMRLTGSAVGQLTLRFIMDWNFTAKRKLTLDKKYFPANPVGLPGVSMQIVSSGPDTRYPNVMHGFSKMITEAKRSIYIQTPYFVPDESLFGALRVAALSGVEVRVMIPAHPDHPFVYWAGLSYLGELLEAGVQCYEYEKGFIHSKTLMIDSQVCSVGTANMDVRSFKLNFECNAFIYNAEKTIELESAFLNDMADCHLITLEAYGRRSKMVKIKESLSRLLSPLL